MTISATLGLSFSNFHITHTENKIFNEIPKPIIYNQYIEYIFILAINVSDIKKIK